MNATDNDLWKIKASKYLTIAIYNHVVLPGLETQRETSNTKALMDSLDIIVLIALPLQK